MMTEQKETRVKENLRQLEDKELLALDGKVVPTTMIPAIWEEKTGQKFSRTAPLQAKKAGRIKPMGQNRSVLYWWRDEIEKAVITQPNKRGRPPKK